MSFDLSADGPSPAWTTYAGLDDRRDSDNASDKSKGKPMATTFNSSRRSLSKIKRAESIEFRLIFIAAFAVFLVAATVERLLPTSWFKRNASRRESIFKQAKDAANTCAAYAFMG